MPPYIIRRDERDALSRLVSPSLVSSCLIARIVNDGVLVVNLATHHSTWRSACAVVESERRLIRRRFVNVGSNQVHLSTIDWEHHFLVGFPSFVVQLSSTLMFHRKFDA